MAEREREETGDPFFQLVRLPSGFSGTTWDALGEELFIFRGTIMDSPLEKFIEWYMSLPVPHRQAIVEFVIFFNIGFDDMDTTNMEELQNAFIKKLLKYSHDKLKGTGLALMLRGNVDFLIRKWGTREGLKESEKFFIGVQEHFSSTGEDFMADRTRKLLRELQFKQEQWSSTNEKWRELVESYLSDSYIDHWWKDLS